MAEQTGLRNNALPYPIYAQPFGVTFPLLDADGDPISPSSADSEVSKNGDTFADCTNEATEIATSSGICYLLLTATEMTSDVVTVRIQSTGAKTTVVTLYPRKLVTLRTGTAAGGAAGSITLDSGASAVDDFYNGCVVAGVLDSTNEVRVITDYVGSTKVASVTPNWNTTPDSDDTFTVYLPEGRQIDESNVKLWNGTAVPSEHTAGYPIVTIKDGTGTGEINTNAGAVALVDLVTTTTTATNVTTVNGLAAGVITAAAIATGAVDADALATDAVEEIRNAITGGAYDLDTDANGRIRIVDGTGTGELDTSSGTVIARDLLDITGVNAGVIIQNAANAGCDSALVDVRLDELLAADSDIDGAAPPTVGSVFHELMTKTAGSFTFDQTTDSLEAIRDRGDAAWITATGFSTLDAAGVRTAVGLASANLDTQLAAIQADLPTRITKNTALSAFEFFMVDSADHITGKTGLTVTATRSLDGAAFAACANSATEVSNGVYKIDLAAADLNANVVTLKFTGTGADARLITIVTQPT